VDSKAAWKRRLRLAGPPHRQGRSRKLSGGTPLRSAVEKLLIVQAKIENCEKSISERPSPPPRELAEEVRASLDDANAGGARGGAGSSARELRRERL
jgi:hypothetical protein